MATALTDPLCLVPQVKDALQIPYHDAEDDDKLERAIEAATLQIHQRCDRQFTNTTTASARAYVAESNYVAHVHDFHTTTDLVVQTDTSANGTYDTTWTVTTDYQVEPLNGQADYGTVPYCTVRAVGSKTFPIDLKGRPRVQVTAQWGWAAVPDPVREAAVIQSAHIFKASEAALGVAGFGDIGALRIRQSLHPTAEALIARYARHPIPVF